MPLPIPTYDQFIEPILRYLAANPAGVAARVVHDMAADALGLDVEARSLMLPSGAQAIYKNRAGWAHDRLKRAGLSESPKRGFWQLTEKGQAFAAAHPGPLDGDAIAHLAMDFNAIKLRGDTSLTNPGNTDMAEESAHFATSSQSPDDLLEAALAELHAKVTEELRDALANVSPSYFESIVLDLLHRMGYGASRSDLKRVGGSGDGGIDGIISLDKLGLEKVYVQAKRWQGTVGRPDIQGFYGALAGQRANKGVFITTSAFTTHAVEFARSVERIVLVDGIRLAALMIEHEVGVSSRTLRIPRLDSDYFDE